MGTAIRPEISKTRKYYIPKHRYYELKHYCLQYRDWKREYVDLSYNLGVSSPRFGERILNGSGTRDTTAEIAITRNHLLSGMEMIEKTAKQADEALSSYILMAVTEGISFTTLKLIYEIPCERDMFYDRYRKFFYLLSKVRG